jgi:hypothetical protein
MKTASVQVSLYANGALVSRAEPERITLDGPGEPGGRAHARAQLPPIELRASIIFDPAELAAIHARTTYGFRALRAMLDALPQCETRGCRVPPRPGHPATHACIALSLSITPAPALARVKICDACAEGARRAGCGVTEFPSAPAVRHLEAYVLQYERENKVPEGER